MDKYQAKLEAIKAKRISKQERFQSFFIFIGMVFTGLFVLPYLSFKWIWALYFYLLINFSSPWMGYVLAGFCILLGLLAVFLVFYCIGAGLKHLTRALSGIKERG